MILRIKNKFVAGLCILLSLVIISSVQAELLFYEGFDYAAGVPVDPWDNAQYQGSETPTIEAGSLSYPGLPTSGGRLAQNDPPGGAFPYTVNDTVAGLDKVFSGAGTYYVTYLGRVQGDEGGEDGNGGPTFASNVDGKYFRPLIRRTDTNVAIARMELNGTGEPSSASFDVNQDSGDAVMYALRIDNDGGAGNDQVRLVVNPDLSAGEPDWSASDMDMSTNLTAGAADYGKIVMNRGHEWDEIRIATTWQEAVPEPSTMILLITGLSLIGVLTSRRQGV